MRKKQKVFIIPPNWRSFSIFVVLLCCLVVFDRITGTPDSVRLSIRQWAMEITFFCFTMYQTRYFTFHKGYIAVRLLGIPVKYIYYHECSSCTIISGVSETVADSLSGRKKTLLFMTFSPKRPFEFEHETVTAYISSVGKRGFFEPNKYAKIIIPPNRSLRCMEIVKECYPNIRFGEEYGRREL